MKKEEYSVQRGDRESEFYIFEEGVVVFWSVPIEEVIQIVASAHKYF